MKIAFLKDGDKTIGYKLMPETDIEKQALGTIRDMYFFGVVLEGEEEPKAMRYDGIETSDGIKRWESLECVKFRAKDKGPIDFAEVKRLKKDATWEECK